MTGQSGTSVRVWVKTEIGPRHVVAQVLDALNNPLGEETVITERHDLYEIANRYGVPLENFEFEGDSAEVIEAEFPPQV
ncbi:hypothetical protein [Streptacidiphilus fuscans]|uniref:Uncharacterized protein n=1 Tax=Streptacidiphilus fuscans TaxID=2789292 RepID=A0A931FC70_9ACTN|nr:hypothetical protein [Streptacidiphilus fuscans]MBF9069422.1 hypothetical protein [Streptacidiphilus fuscans]